MITRSELSILIGNVGSGKSTFADLFFLGSLDIILSSDKYRAVIGENENDQSVSRQVFDVLEWNLEYFLKYTDFDIIIDSTAKTPKARKRFLDIGKKYGAKLTAYYFDVPLEICKERNARRDRVVPNEIIERFQRELVFPTKEEGFDSIFVIGQDGNLNNK